MSVVLAPVPSTARPDDTTALRRPGGPLRSPATYGAIFATSLHNQLAYVGEWALRGIFLAMILYIFLQLWRATYGGQGQSTIGGFTLAQMIWYLALTESIVLSRPQVNREVDAEVRSGEIAYTLLRPYAYAGYRLATYLAERLLRFATTLGLACLLALVYVGPVPIAAPDVGAALLTLALAMLIDFLGAFGIGLLAFWTEDTSSIGLIYDRLIMLLGGMLLPLEVFPEPLATITRALPFSALVYGPARLALGAAPESLWLLLAKQAVILAAGATLVWLLHRAAFRRINLNGG